MTLPIPARILHSHVATLGKTGSGKSSVNRLLVEHLLDQRKRVCVIDPKGDWWGLKSSADGKSAGYPVIALGDFKEPRATDVPINDRSGKHVAELIASGNRPCVIGFRGWMPAQLVRFWIDFASTLFNANEGELYMVLSEVQNLAPKGKILDPESGKCLHWTNRIMSEGRGIGFIFLIESQRPQKVHNDTLDCCETLIAMRVAHPRSREAIKEWMDGNGDPAKAKEVLATLAQMKRGEGWVWSPENEYGPTRVQFPMFSTFDSFAPPQAQKRVTNAGWSTVDLEAVKTKLAAVITEQKANDPRELKAEIERLKAEKRKLEAANHHVAAVAPSKDQIERATSAAVKTATAPLIRQLEQMKKLAQQTIDNLSRAVAPLNTLANLEDLQDRTKNVLDRTNIVLPAPTLKPPADWPKPVNRPAPAVSHTNGDGTISRAEQNMLDQLAELAALGIAQPSKVQLSLMCGYSNPRSGGFSEPIAKILERGLIVYPVPGEVSLTDAGRAAAAHVERPLTTAELHSRLFAKLGSAETKILKEIMSVYPNAINKDLLASACGYSNVRSGGFSEPIGRLRELGIVDYPQTGQVKAAEWLYL